MMMKNTKSSGLRYSEAFKQHALELLLTARLSLDPGPYRMRCCCHTFAPSTKNNRSARAVREFFKACGGAGSLAAIIAWLD